MVRVWLGIDGQPDEFEEIPKKLVILFRCAAVPVR